MPSAVAHLNLTIPILPLFSVMQQVHPKVPNQRNGTNKWGKHRSSSNCTVLLFNFPSSCFGDILLSLLFGGTPKRLCRVLTNRCQSRAHPEQSGMETREVQLAIRTGVTLQGKAKANTHQFLHIKRQTKTPFPHLESLKFLTSWIH